MNDKEMIVRLPMIKTTTKPEAKVYPSTEYVLYFDGCSKGNPGEAGIGAVIYKDGLEFWASCKYIGNKRTNNESEYCALIFGLEAAIDHNIKKLSVCGDSLLVINQLNKIYKVKHPNLHELYEKANDLKTQFEYIDFNHVYRKDNKRADQLSNLALEFVDHNKESEQLYTIEEEPTNLEEELIVNKSKVK
jgi:ribonuclease HI